MPSGTTRDLDGHFRFSDDPETPDTGRGNPPLVDLGVYEFAPTCVGDLDGSGRVDVADLVAVLGAWGPCEGCPQDLNGDRTVDIGDLIELLSRWGPCP